MKRLLLELISIVAKCRPISVDKVTSVYVYVYIYVYVCVYV